MTANNCPRCGSVLDPSQSCPVCTVSPAETPTINVDAGIAGPTDQSPTLIAADSAGSGANLPGYELLGVVGKGGMGVVHRARQIALDRLVAIKLVRSEVLNDVHRARFLQEARSSAKLSHPNIVVVYDLGQRDEQLYLIMELLEGETLARRIARVGKLDERQTWTLLRQAAAGLAHAEQAGIVHRDIKPENLFLTGSGNEPILKVMDFGLALLHERSEGEAITSTGTILGTPIYMAPEQFDSSRVDARADIYSLGVTAWNMLTGKVPYASASIWEIVAKKCMPLVVPTDLSPAGQALLNRMLSPDIGDRPASHAELLAAIDRLLFELPSYSAIAPVPVSTSKPGVRGPRWIIAIIVLAMLGVAGGAALYFRPVLSHETWKAGNAVVLFDGKNLAGWRFGKGTWKPDRDAEGGTVLAGQGVIARPLPEFDSYRLLLGVDSTRCPSVELQFGIVGDGPAGNCFALRITNESIALGKRAGDDAFAPIASIPAPPPPDREAETPYREVRIERLAGQWHAYYHGKRVGETRAMPNERAEFRLQADGGVARFEAIEVMEMKANSKQ